VVEWQAASIVRSSHCAPDETQRPNGLEAPMTRRVFDK